MKLLKDKMEISQRTAFFTSIIALVQDGNLQIFEGKCEGHIGSEGRGEVGFGFDPIFIPNEQESKLDIIDQPTFSQLSLEIKNQISHRAKSMVKLRNYLENNG